MNYSLFLQRVQQRIKSLFLLTLFTYLFLYPALTYSKDKISIYQGKDGPYDISEVDRITLTDADRNRQIPLRIFYPKAEGPFPIIINSHTAGGSKSSQRFLGTYWASYGYIAIFPTHFGSDISMIRNDKPLKSPENLNILKEMFTVEVYKERNSDIRFLMDSLDQLGELAQELSGLMDTSTIGISGHSLGSTCVMLLAGGFPEYKQEDPRPKAFLAMNPTGGDESMTDINTAWSGIRRPMMTMVTSLSKSYFMKKNAEWRLRPFRKMKGSNKYNLWIDDAKAFVFRESFPTNNDPEMPWYINPDHQEYIKQTSLAFWDAYLKDSKTAKKFLRADVLKKKTKGKTKISYKEISQ